MKRFCFFLLLIVLLLFCPVCLDLGYYFIRKQILTFQISPFFLQYFYIDTVYLLFGGLLGLFTIKQDRRTAHSWQISPIQLFAAFFAVIFAVFFGSPLSELIFGWRSFDPYVSWMLGAGVLFVTAWNREKDTIFSVIFSLLCLLVLPSAIYVAKALVTMNFEPFHAWTPLSFSLFAHGVYFCCGLICAVPFLRRQMLGKGQWYLCKTRLISGLLLLIGAFLFNNNGVIPEIRISETFYLWTITAGFVTVSSWQKRFSGEEI